MHANGGFVKSTQVGPLRDLLQRLHTTLVWWINSHILKVDIQLKDCVQSKEFAK